MTTVAIVGSRHWHDYDAFYMALTLAYTDHIDRIVSGGADGVDAMAARFARDRGIEFVEYPPNLTLFKTFTDAAHARNQRIVDAADVLIAFPGPRSKGTHDTIRRARRKGIRVVRRMAPV